MSYKNFKLSLEKAMECAGYEILEGLTENKILEGESLLSLKYSKQFRNYLQQVGTLTFEGCELYGSSNREYSGLPFGDSIVLALNDRKELNLPKEYLPIYFYDDFGDAYLDYSQLNSEGEPPVILAQYQGEKTGWVVIEKLADDLGDFLLELVEQQLETQEN